MIGMNEIVECISIFKKKNVTSYSFIIQMISPHHMEETENKKAKIKV